MDKQVLALACTVVIFGHCSVKYIISEPSLQCDRDLDVVELWAGVGSVAAAAEGRKLQAQSFDILQGQDQNICARPGFVSALRQVTRLRRRGLLAMAPARRLVT